jgi:signal transduction histidine kinase
VAIDVIDTGRGVPRLKLDAIFDSFIQVDSSHSRAGQSTGLGLAISRDQPRSAAISRAGWAATCR